ncbi:ankyrin repeat and SOCS box protein 12-like [Pelobates fuscus]|uniref:ankyrin repeat and SOCS box protein 12-like n=1 Tax=Pelobates fuscus TaxID=191477 RepID=UPI002FE4CAD0
MLNVTKYDYNRAVAELRDAVFKDKPQYLNELLSQDLYKRLINTAFGWCNPITYLHLAANNGFIQCIQILLANGADVDRINAAYETPLYSAVHAGHFDCVEELLKAGANPSGNSYTSPVVIASCMGKANILKKLLEYGAAANLKTKIPIVRRKVSSSDPLYLSALNDNLECFKMLLLYGADPDYNCIDNKLMKQSSSVIEFCLLHHCKTAFVKLLIDFGANIYLPGIDIQFGRSDLNKETEELILRERGNLRLSKSN